MAVATVAIAGGLTSFLVAYLVSTESQWAMENRRCHRVLQALPFQSLKILLVVWQILTQVSDVGATVDVQEQETPSKDLAQQEISICLTLVMPFISCQVSCRSTVIRDLISLFTTGQYGHIGTNTGVQTEWHVE